MLERFSLGREGCIAPGSRAALSDPCSLVLHKLVRVLGLLQGPYPKIRQVVAPKALSPKPNPSPRTSFSLCRTKCAILRSANPIATPPPNVIMCSSAECE